MKKFIVASSSPRRRELLEFFGFDFKVIPSGADENLQENIDACEAVKELSKRKAESVFAENKDAVVLGCDTVVSLDGAILGKPSDEEDARKMLRILSGRTHQVFSGVTIMDKDKTETFAVCSEVQFYELSDEDIDSYIKTGEPMDKAGAYGIQGLGGALVRKIDGDYYNIVGLPISKTIKVLAGFGVKGSTQGESRA